MAQDVSVSIAERLALSKAVEQERGCVATNMGLVDMTAGNSSEARAMLQAQFT
jgi:hypothetical protein